MCVLICRYYNAQRFEFEPVNITVNRTRQPFHETVPVRIKLRAIHLQYSVTTKEPSDEDHLFSSRLSLPYRTLAENIFKRFVISHLVK